MLERGIIETCVKPLAFSSLSAVPKPNEPHEMRMILDMRAVNEALIPPPSFRLQTLANLAATARGPLFGVTVDLASAFYQLTLHPDSRPLTAFRWTDNDGSERLFHFIGLPMGCSHSPSLLHRATRPIVRQLQSEGVTMELYVDDGLILAQSAQICSRHLQRAIGLFQQAGYQFKPGKGTQTPSQQLSFLGYVLDLSQARIRLFVPRVKIARMVRMAATLLRSARLGARVAPTACLRLIGLAEFLSRAITAARMHTLALRRDLLRGARIARELPPIRGPKTICLSPQSERDLEWWAQRANLIGGRELVVISEFSYTLLTDASALRAGAVLLASRDIESDALASMSIPWSDVATIARALAPFESITVKRMTSLQSLLRTLGESPSPHITFLESLSALLGLATLAPPNSETLVLSDATATVALLSRLSSRSERLATLIPWLIAVCEQRQIRITSRHIPGEANTRADALSRAPVGFHEWQFDKAIFWSTVVPYVQALLPPDMREPLVTWVDCFASAANALLPRYHTWRGPDPQAEAMDTLSVAWNPGVVRILVPPLPLRHAALAHQQRCPGWASVALHRAGRARQCTRPCGGRR